MAEIPVLDLRADSFAGDMWAACVETGFFAIVNHGIDVDLFGRMRALCAEIFALDEAAKQAAMITPDNYRGFIPLGFFTPNRAEVNGAAPDMYEGFKLHWECPAGHPARDACALYGTNRWLDAVPDMRPTILQYWEACAELGGVLLGHLAPRLGVGAEDLRSWHDTPLTNMTLLHYPAHPPAGDAAGIHAHKDTNVLTFLHPDPVGGLEIRVNGGQWIEATPPADALLVNTGEMLELWSGGAVVATPHRVVNRSGQERYSFPWFLVPNHDVTVEPLNDTVEGFARAPMPVGELSAEVWRTNWPDEQPSVAGHDLGSLDRGSLDR